MFREIATLDETWFRDGGTDTVIMASNGERVCDLHYAIDQKNGSRGAHNNMPRFRIRRELILLAPRLFAKLREMLDADAFCEFINQCLKGEYKPMTATAVRQQELEQQLDAEFNSMTCEGDLPGDVDEEKKHFLKRYMRMRLAKEAAIERLKNDFEAARKRLESELAAVEYRFGEAARNVAGEMLAASKKKSMKTLWGTFGFRTKAAALVIKQEQDCLQSLMAKAPKLVRKEVKVSIDKAGLNDFSRNTAGFRAAVK
ncbi:host-nuclease inhibitor Gam family protein [Candidatus Sumerlaeota bacterium]|nr:host-nuclease inhibitor Gam family protein [Candidatus Sumerlaeota bacterium]